MTDTVNVTGVTKSYGKVPAVIDVTCSLKEGETIALVGHNGAGKTTLIKLMLGLIRPDSGMVRVLGEDPAAGQFAARRRLGYLPENVSFNMALTGRETLSFYARLKRVPLDTVGALLERVGLAGAADRRVGTYSKGMRQRLGLAQALLGRPRVLLLDEPTTGLDPALRHSFYEIVAELRADGATVLLSSHALTELEGKADRVVIVNRGAKIADGTIEELRQIAKLPTRIRVRLAECEAGKVDDWIGRTGAWKRINGHVLEIDAEPSEKISLLRSAASTDAPVVDLDVAPPSLDELYAHFLGAEEAPQ
ncbi:ABC transporter ATP-binding protein [Mesorhizobium sp.]|uniref:ABC transporter ATP-binding protein n=1 Tax=Mesorhizobium sp. TaxID=1871066 RepID=UPI0012077209|nr:ABC transporter ATP-binding protein [Mesorhizobium sp.]TIO04683.1 MAG: ABC transporter ATP-binding protein [Mesorhizobium sp.]TIO29411.1 MAG: ABC transporter ATP-binding protein [Mesorhizobium sp.]TIP09225.1 MAG: ABC transporter ATP-binding protein [Mesorhizobium sp.]